MRAKKQNTINKGKEKYNKYNITKRKGRGRK
jgi:hypothetical protein